jgi:DNA-binding CsgD family transcriptional regulator
MSRTTPLQTPEDLRAERHARALSQTQTAARPDPQVLRLSAQGYVPVQIASMLRMSVADVKLMLATQNEVRR